MPVSPSGSTMPTDPDPGWFLWERRMRWFAFGVITVLVLLGVTGLLGVRTSVSSVSAGDYSLEVEYATVTRAGLATPFSIVVHRQASSESETLTVAVTSDYLALFDDNGMEPTPAGSHNTPEWTTWTFEIPPGEPTLRIDLDARLEPAVQWGRSGVVKVLSGDAELVSTSFTTLVMP